MRDAPILRSVRPSDVDDLAESGVLREYRRGTYLFHQGDRSTEVFFLVRGRVEVSSLSANGHRQMHATLEPSQFLGELAVLGDIPRTATVVALEDSVLWLSDGERFLGFLSRHFDATRELLRTLVGQIQSHESFVEDLLFLDLKGRVAKRLIQLVSPALDDLPRDGAIVPAVVTHSDLASLCGGSRENVTRIISEFQRRGLVERAARRYVLKDVTGLGRIAGL
jgi:CRP/FNR family transcriptional regulator, cyclic AMP receptor protein